MGVKAEDKFKWNLDITKAYGEIKHYALIPRVTLHDTQIVLIQFGYYAGILPFYYNPTSDLFVLNKTYKTLFWWILSLAWCTLGSLGLMAFLVHGIIFDTLVLTNMFDVVAIFLSAGFLTTWLLHLQTLVKRQEMVQILNGYNQHVNHFKRKSKLLR